MNLSKDSLNSICLYLYPTEILLLLKTCKLLEKQLSNENFWSLYLKNKYFIDSSNIRLAFKVERVLKHAWSKELYMNIDCLKTLIYSKIYLEELDNFSNQQILGLLNFEDCDDSVYKNLKMNELPLPEPNGDYPDDISYHYVFRPGEKAYYNEILKLIASSTLYFIPTGTYKIKFNKDLCIFFKYYYLSDDCYDQFKEYIQNLLRIYEKTIFFQFFGNLN